MSGTSKDAVITKDHTFPEGFLQLFSAADVKNSCEGLIVLLHSFLLEIGYIPKDVGCDVYSGMPDEWKTENFCKVQYYHKTLPEALCWVTFVPLYGKLTVQGTTTPEHIDSAYWTVEIDAFCNSKGNLNDSLSLFTHVEELSRVFKDEFSYRLLAILYESMGCKPTFGLSGLLDEMKINILKYLPIESVISLSSVNKNFQKLASSDYIWHYMFIRDFGLVDSSSGSTSNEEWKEKYKEEYQKRKTTRHAFRPHLDLYHPYHLPEIFPVAPNFGVNPQINLDPALQEAFPFLRDRFRPRDWFYPNGFNFF